MSKTYIAVPPGATIQEQLENKNMSLKEFSAKMDISEELASDLCAGNIALTPNLANRLELVLGVPATFWNKLEALYRETFEKIKKENSFEIKKEVTIFDVAVYILKKQGSLTTMKLQKLCYYSQAWSLAWEEKPLFPEDFQAWANGPVCKELYEQHRGKFMISADDISDCCSGKDSLTDDEKNIINEVIRCYADEDGNWLSELTHKERPWKETREKANAKPGDFCDMVIDKELIADYYAGL